MHLHQNGKAQIMPVVAGRLAMTAIKQDVDAIEHASYKIDLIKNITNTDAKEKFIGSC